MGVVLESIVPWGRLFSEYQRMFALSHRDLAGRILGCADGPSSFNCEATRRSHQVVSCDPIYRFETEEIRRRIEATFPSVVRETERNRESFVWREFRSVDELARVRSRAMNLFLEDYESGRDEGRYIEAELPALHFADGEFDLALCSHFLFLYSDHLSEEFHVRSLIELCRVAREVRVFPLLDLAASRSRHVAPVIEALAQRGVEARVEQVPYEFQRGGHQMLRVGTRASSRPARPS